MFSLTPKEDSFSLDNCCSPQPKGKMKCPNCGEKAKAVLAKTLNSLLKDKVELSCKDGFYYCKTPSCKNIYFRNEEVLKQEDISVVVGLKEGSSPDTVCYCFKWTKEKIKIEIQENAETLALEDIKSKMKNISCNCELLNPSGGCCLGDITNVIIEIKDSLKEIGFKDTLIKE